MIKRRLERMARRGLACVASVAVAAAGLAGCTAMPGMAVESRDDNPTTSWTESRVREVYGTPGWSAPLADGGKALYFEYKTAPRGATAKTVSALTAITTFGLVRDAGSLDFRLVTLIGPDGKLVCADRASIRLALISCPHERRLAVLEELPEARAAVYRDMLIDLEPRRYATGHFYVVSEPALSPAAVAAAREAGAEASPVTDGPYYFAAECTVLTRWYALQLEVLGRDPSPSRGVATPYARALHEAGASRGMTVADVDSDVAIISDFWQQWLDKGELGYPTRAAATCLSGKPGRTWSNNSLQRFDSAYHERVKDRVRLAQALALARFPEAPAKPAGSWSIVSAPSQFYRLGWKDASADDTTRFYEMELHSAAWNAALEAERRRLGSDVTIEALAQPLPVIEQVFVEMNRNGKLPSRRLHQQLRATLDAQLALPDLAGAARTIATLGRYHLAQAPSAHSLGKAGDLLASAAWIADRIGAPDEAASMALFAGDVYLASIQQMLIDNGLGDRDSRDARREIVNFVPYSYERKNFDGTVTRYEVSAANFDAEGMLGLIRDMSYRYPNVVEQVAYALPAFTDPLTAAGYLEQLADDADEIFSSKGAYLLRERAAQAYELAGHDQQALLASMRAKISQVRSRSRDNRRSREYACKTYYVPVRETFAQRFGNPDYGQVRELFGKPLASGLRDIDRRCDYGDRGLFGSLIP